MVIGLDIDGVFANFNLHFAYLLVKETGKDLLPKEWTKHPEVLAPVWNWQLHWGYTEEEVNRTWDKHILAKNSMFWFDIPLMPYAKDALTRINILSRYHGHDVYFMTHRPGPNAKLHTERWLYDKGIAYPTVLIVDANDKPEVLSRLRADVFIDDKLLTVQRAVGTAARVYLQDAPYNQETVKSTTYIRVNNVQDMLKKEGLWEDSTVRKAMFWKK